MAEHRSKNELGRSVPVQALYQRDRRGIFTSALCTTFIPSMIDAEDEFAVSAGFTMYASFFSNTALFFFHCTITIGK